MPSLRGLRKRLDMMFPKTPPSREDQFRLRHQHVNEIEEIREQYPHIIQVEERAPKELSEDLHFNCYLYAFDLHRDKDVLNFTINHFILMLSTFVENLLKRPLAQEISEVETRNGDVIIYFEEYSSTTPEHAGRIEGGHVKSKWTYSNVYKHPLWEVPLGYGNAVKFYREFNKDDVKQLFHKFI